MYKVIEITSFAQAFELFFEDSYDNRINRLRSSYVFRGMNNASYDLQTSFFRNCGTDLIIEESMLRNFSKYAIMEHPELATTIWRQMIIGQHHGLPTRLLDWSYSPLVALHFATDESNLTDVDKNDSVVWKVNLEEINSLMPIRYQKALKDCGAYILTVDMINSLANNLTTYDSDMSNKSFVFMEPPSIDSRIINQYALFSIIPNEITNLTTFFEKHSEKTIKYVINKKAKWEIRDMLDQMNVSERIIYPGLDGLAQWLKRHYFVKKI